MPGLGRGLNLLAVKKRCRSVDAGSQAHLGIGWVQVAVADVLFEAVLALLGHFSTVLLSLLFVKRWDIGVNSGHVKHLGLGFVHADSGLV